LIHFADAPGARAIPFSATLGLFLEGQTSAVQFEKLYGEAAAGAGDSLQLDGAIRYGYGQSFGGPSFFIYAAFSAVDAFGGTLAPGKGPQGGFGGSVPLHRFVTFGFVTAYQTACFGLARIGLSSPAFPCGPSGTLVAVAGWTTGTVTLTGMGGTKLQPRGSDARTPGGRGHILLVTPIRIEGGLHPSPLVGFGTLTLALVPEPGTLGLTLAGMLGLVALGRRRARLAR
jgi:hypothetical protein